MWNVGYVLVMFQHLCHFLFAVYWKFLIGTPFTLLDHNMLSILYPPLYASLSFKISVFH